MKKIWCCVLLILAFSATGISAAEVPDLLGNWSGHWSMYYATEGYSESMENGSITASFTEQKDRIFNGNLTFKGENMPDFKTDFAGAIGLDNKTFYMAEFDEGYALGTLISNDEMEVIYLEDGGNMSVVIDRLYRIKE